MCAGRPRINDNSLYSNPSFVLLETIREELQNLHCKQFNNEMLSIFLGRDKNYVTKKYYKIRCGKLGYISKDIFLRIKERVTDHFYKELGCITEKIIKTFEDYEDYLSRHKYIRSEARSKIYHPNIKSDFFRFIVTDEQRYYLGIMFSDGYIIKEEDEYRKYYRIGLKLNPEDEKLIDRLIYILGLNPGCKHLYEEWQKHNNKLVKIRYFRIHFANQQMAADLISWGVIPNKSNIIRLPEFPDQEDYYPFLMGCFDGDGEAGSTRLWSGSRRFLEDIKIKFSIPNEIRYRESVYGSAWGLSLGPNLFNKMNTSYPNSITRKRKKMREWKKSEEK